MDDPNVDLSDEALEKAFPGEPAYDVLVTVNGDWLAYPKGEDKVIAYMISGASKADIETFQMNSNLALEWILDQDEAWEIKVPQEDPPVFIELLDDPDED